MHEPAARDFGGVEGDELKILRPKEKGEGARTWIHAVAAIKSFGLHVLCAKGRRGLGRLKGAPLGLRVQCEQKKYERTREVPRV